MGKKHMVNGSVGIAKKGLTKSAVAEVAVVTTVDMVVNLVVTAVLQVAMVLLRLTMVVVMEVHHKATTKIRVVGTISAVGKSSLFSEFYLIISKLIFTDNIGYFSFKIRWIYS